MQRVIQVNATSDQSTNTEHSGKGERVMDTFQFHCRTVSEDLEFRCNLWAKLSHLQIF